MHGVSLLGIVLRTVSRKAWWIWRQPALEPCGRVTEGISKWLTSSTDEVLFHSCPVWKSGAQNLLSPSWPVPEFEIPPGHEWGRNFLSEYQFLGKVPIENHLHGWESHWVLSVKVGNGERKVDDLGRRTYQSQSSSPDNILWQRNSLFRIWN